MSDLIRIGGIQPLMKSLLTPHAARRLPDGHGKALRENLARVKPYRADRTWFGR